MGILRDGSTLHQCLFWNVRFPVGKIVGLWWKKPWELRNKVIITFKGVLLGEDQGLAWDLSGYFCWSVENVMPWNLPGNKMWCKEIWVLLDNLLLIHVIQFFKKYNFPYFSCLSLCWFCAMNIICLEFWYNISCQLEKEILWRYWYQGKDKNTTAVLLVSPWFWHH